MNIYRQILAFAAFNSAMNHLQAASNQMACCQIAYTHAVADMNAAGAEVEKAMKEVAACSEDSND